MKKKLFIGFILCLMTTGYAYAESHIYVNAVNFFDRTKYASVSQYDCSFNNVQCSVDKVKLLQTGKVMYDSDCTGSEFEQGRYTKQAMSDVRLKRFAYCRLTSKTIAE